MILLESRRRSFVDAITAPLDSLATLTALKPHFRLGLVSNFPCGQTIRLSLERTGLIRFLDAVVVSGEIGYVKPHPLPFTLILEQLQVSPAEAVFVGDNWLADVQGAKRAGLRAVWFRRWEPPEDFPAQPGDHEPDHIINEPSALERLFVP